MTDLSPTELALRVGILAGVLGVVGYFPPMLQGMAAVVLAIGSLIYFYEIWVVRGARRKQRDSLVWALLLLAGAAVMQQGWASYAATPLVALAAVCIGLWFAGTLGDAGEETPE